MAKKKKKPIKKTPPHVAYRWLEFAGAKPPSRLSAALKTLQSSIGALRVVGTGGHGNPELVVTVRRVEKEGCESRAEIAGFYDKTLAPGEPCLGPAVVKAILDKAAKDLCCATLECPSEECPCDYTPQAALAKYSCGNWHERGFLLQDARVWNCHCKVTA